MDTQIRQHFSLTFGDNFLSIIFKRHQDRDYCVHFVDEGTRKLRWAGNLSISRYRPLHRVHWVSWQSVSWSSPGGESKTEASIFTAQPGKSCCHFHDIPSVTQVSLTWEGTVLEHEFQESGAMGEPS